MNRLLTILAALAATLLTSGISHADQEACLRAIVQVEASAGVPPRLMQAIALAESGRWDADKRASFAWPWTVNAEGRGRFLPTKEAAIAEVQRLRARGVRSVDVGCMQVNLMHHPDAFESLEDALDPVRNATYAGEFLRELYAARKSWPDAVAHYHSATPERHEPYRKRVYALWNGLQAPPRQPPPRVHTAAAVTAPAVAPAVMSSRAFLPTGATGNWIVMRGRIMQVNSIARR
jgi:hypothetical protein